jgi:hypothetical protein
MDIKIRKSVKKFRYTLPIQNCDMVDDGGVLLKAYANEDYPVVYMNRNSFESDMIRWLLFNVNDKDWDFIPGALFFTHESDALAFKLVWK